MQISLRKTSMSFDKCLYPWAHTPIMIQNMFINPYSTLLSNKAPTLKRQLLLLLWLRFIYLELYVSGIFVTQWIIADCLCSVSCFCDSCLLCCVSILCSLSSLSSSPFIVWMKGFIFEIYSVDGHVDYCSVYLLEHSWTRLFMDLYFHFA